MSRKVIALAPLCLFLLCTQSHADFKYVQSSQITGGMMAGMVKFMGHFNKKASRPAQTTTYVKGAYLRSDNEDGSYRIIDLKGQRIIHVNPSKQAYSVITFEQMREMMQRLQQSMHEAAQKQSQSGSAGGGTNNSSGNASSNITLTPRIEVTPTGQTQNLLGQTAQEVKIKVALDVQGTDAQNQRQSGTLSTDIDSWIAPSISGYKEVSAFYKQMATEIGWTPGGFGMDPRMRQAMVQYYKGGKMPEGLPMLQVMSLLTAGQAQGQSQTQTAQQPPAQSSQSSDMAATPSAAAVKALGGMFGHWGHKKKQQEQDQNQDQNQQQTAQNTNAASNSSTGSNSLMEITVRVTSYSTDPLDASLFTIPAGYTQITANAQRMAEGGH